MEGINNFENVGRCAYCRKQINTKHKDTFGINEFDKLVCRGIGKGAFCMEVDVDEM